jgi:glutaredoxin
MISKPGCHLCDDARTAITGVIAELGDAASVSLDEVSIFDDRELRDKYAEEIPVVLINGRVHNIWRVDRERFAKAIIEASA